MNYTVRKSCLFSCTYLFVYMIIYLYKYISWIFILFHELNPILLFFILFLKLFHLWPLEAPSVWILCSCDNKPNFFFLNIFWLFDTTSHSSFNFIYLALTLKSNTSPRRSVSFCWRIVIRDHDLGTRYTQTGFSLSLVLFSHW